MNGQGSKRRSNANRLPAFLVGFLLGGLASAVALWLLAPGAGKKAQSRLQKQGAKLRHEVAAAMEEVGEVQQRTKDMLGAGKK